MTRLLAGVCATALMLMTAPSFADDMMKKDPMAKHDQMMKECMAKAEMKKDGMTKEQMMKSCTEQMKMHEDAMKKGE